MGEIVEGASDGAPVGLPQVAAAGAAGAPVEADGGLAARCADALQNWTPPKRFSIGLQRAEFPRFVLDCFRLSWET